MRILVAEDDSKLRSHLKQALTQAGYAVDETGDGLEALWLGKENSYDSAVLDISMPGMDGVSVTRAHELRTPLTLLRMRIEQSAAEIPPELSEQLQEELSRLSKFVERSLLAARAESGGLEFQRASVEANGMDGHRIAFRDNGRVFAVRLSWKPTTQ